MSNLTYGSAMDKGTLTIAIGGSVDSDNSRELAAYCEKECGQAHDYLVLDLEGLEYISSAGLRVLLLTRKKEPKPVKAVNVSQGVYEILEMTGFTKVLDATRAMRRVSIDGCEKIGQGGQGSVYRLDKDTIIKVFNPGMFPEEVEKERNYAQQAFLRGLPTAISYDIVKCGDCLGVVFEMINADTVAAAINKEPDKLEHYAKEYAKMARMAHGVDMSGTDFPDINAMRGGGFHMAHNNGMLSEQQADDCKRLFDTLPERTTFLHGDLNPNNVMIQDGELLLIDMGAAGYGHPLIDLAGVYLSTAFAGKSGGSIGDHIEGMSNALSPEYSLRIWEVFVREYFGTDDPQMLEAIEYQCETFALLTAVFIWTFGSQMGMAQKLTEMCKTVCESLLFPQIEERLKGLNPRDSIWGGPDGGATQATDKVSETERRSLLDKILGRGKKAIAASGETAKITVDSKIKDIVANEGAAAVLERNIPGITTDKQLKLAYGMTLRAIQKFPQANISAQQFEEIERELAAL